MKKNFLSLTLIFLLSSCAYLQPNRNIPPVKNISSEEKISSDTAEYIPTKGERPVNIYTAENLQIEMSKGACYGRCPVYTLKILGDGSVKFEGIRFTKSEGMQERKISQEEISAIVRKFEEAKFFEMKDRYENRGVSDLPSTTITISLEGKKKSVYKYFGAPPAFKDLEDAIEKISGAEAWIYD